MPFLVACFMVLSLIVCCLIVQNSLIKSYKRYEFYGKNIDHIKVEGKKMIVKGKAFLTHKLDSGTDTSLKLLKKKKRLFIITSDTKYYSLNWSKVERISKKKAIACIKHLRYCDGFQVKVNGEKIDKMYILNSGN